MNALAETVERALDDRERQGLPRHVQDPGTLERVAAVVQEDLTRKSAP